MNTSLDTYHNIRIRRTTASDLGWVRQIENDPLNAPYICQWSHETHLKALDDPDIAHFVILDHQDDCRVGYVILTGITNLNHSLCLYRLVISEKGKGYGRDLLRLAKKIAFEQFHGHRFWLDVFEGNERARQLYLSEGFVEEGFLREAIRVGSRYASITIMSVLEQEYSRE